MARLLLILFRIVLGLKDLDIVAVLLSGFHCVTGSSSCKIWAWWKSFVTSSLANLKRILLFCRAQGHFYQSLNAMS